MALVWLYARQVPLALLPFTVYSIFHVATYTRSYLIPTFHPPGTKSALADNIGRFIKQYYDTSMGFVATLEILLLFRLLLSAITFSRGSWLLLTIYATFLRTRYSQSIFVQQSLRHLTARVDALVAHQSTPPAVRNGWEKAKLFVGQAYQSSHVAYQPKSSKKPQ